jgi:hypothetical protein
MRVDRWEFEKSLASKVGSGSTTRRNWFEVSESATRSSIWYMWRSDSTSLQSLSRSSSGRSVSLAELLFGGRSLEESSVGESSVGESLVEEVLIGRLRFGEVLIFSSEDVMVGESIFVFVESHLFGSIGVLMFDLAGWVR